MSDTPDVNASTPQRVPVIAIDGPSGSGKGAVTQRLAAALGFHILDSGALYRLIGLAARKHQVGLADEVALAAIARQLDVNFVATDDAEEPLQVELEGETVTRLIRTDAAGTDASAVARLPLVKQLTEHLNTCTSSLLRHSNTNNFNLFTHLDNTALNTTSHNRTTTRN